MNMNVFNLSLVFVFHAFFFTIKGSFEFLNHLSFYLIVNNLTKSVNKPVKSAEVARLNENEFTFRFFISCVAFKFINCLIVISWLCDSNSVVKIIKLVERSHYITVSWTVNPLGNVFCWVCNFLQQELISQLSMKYFNTFWAKLLFNLK
jgi:hypothetical protein